MSDTINKPRILYIGDRNSVFSYRDHKILSADYQISMIYINLNKKNYWGLLRSAVSVIKNILFYDVTITWTADIHTAYVVFISKVFQKKSIVIVGGYEVCDMPEIGYGLQMTPVRGRLAKWAIQNANAAIVPSVAYQRRVMDLVGVNAYVVPNCSNTPDAPPQTGRNQSVVMIASQFSDAGNFALLKGMGVYDGIASKIPETQFCVIGTVDESIRKQYPHLCYLGRINQEDLYKTLTQTKVYCQLSYTESFGVGLLEAIQCGCVPVVTDRDGMAELVGDNGYKISYGDVDAGVVAVKCALADNRDRAEIILTTKNKYSKENRKLMFTKIMEIIK
jgi:glycosyltransferase involved in cell wall biosynthesis